MDIKSVIIEHPRTSHWLSKTVRQAENVSWVGSGKSYNSPLYSETKKSKNLLNKKNVKIINWMKRKTFKVSKTLVLEFKKRRKDDKIKKHLSFELKSRNNY